MRLPMKARNSALLMAVIAASSVTLAGCAADATSPTGLAPEAASYGVLNSAGSNGTYTFVVNPAVSTTLVMGDHRLVLPANAICDLGTSGYGASTWNNSCSPQSSTLTITAVVTTSMQDHPRVDFSPALRFSPSAPVQLYLWDAKASMGTAKKYSILYCVAVTGSTTGSGCTDESILDPDVALDFVPGTYYLKRRVKHFSGYVVAE